MCRELRLVDRDDVIEALVTDDPITRSTEGFCPGLDPGVMTSPIPCRVCPSHTRSSSA